MKTEKELKFNEIFDSIEKEDQVIISFKKEVKDIVLYDPGANHSGFCKSSLSRIDGKLGRLFYMGTPIEEILDQYDYTALANALINNGLNELSNAEFKKATSEFYRLDPNLKIILDSLPRDMHPMDFLMIGVTSLSSIESTYIPLDSTFSVQSSFIISQLFVIAAYYRIRIEDKPWTETDSNKPIHYRFLQSISNGFEDYYNIDNYAKIFDVILILHAEHGQNCSTSTVRNIASAGGDIYTAIASGIAAFKGKLHGGASQQVSEMYDYLLDSKANIEDFVQGKVNKKELIFGFGHRIYKSWDPRALIMFEMLKSNSIIYQPVEDLKKLAFELVTKITTEEYFIKRNIFPNPDLFNNIFYSLIGVPSKMNTVMLSLSRIIGWLAHYNENNHDKLPIMRPQEIYKF